MEKHRAHWIYLATAFAMLSLLAACSTQEEAGVEVAGQEANVGVSTDDDTTAGVRRGFADDTPSRQYGVARGPEIERGTGVQDSYAYREEFREDRGNLDEMDTESTYRRDEFASRRELDVEAEGDLGRETYGREDLAQRETDLEREGIEREGIEREGIERDSLQRDRLDREGFAQQEGEEPRREQGREVALGERLNPMPPQSFKKLSSFVEIDDFIPGLGALYVAEENLPVGPYLGYDEQGTLVNITFMVPLSKLEEMQAEKGWTDLQSGVFHGRIDHVDIAPAEAHAGLDEPHVHVILWLIAHDQEERRVGAHKH